jgi:hypothetical protein
MIPPQIKRLVPLFMIFIGLFLVIRHFLVPDTFGQLGHYRADALGEIAAKEMVYGDPEDCKACHDDILEKISNSEHAGLSCLICHGPGLEHAGDPQLGNIHKPAGRDFCGKCHAYNSARPADAVFQVNLDEHNTDFENCTDCHNPHDVWEDLQ